MNYKLELKKILQAIQEQKRYSPARNQSYDAVVKRMQEIDNSLCLKALSLYTAGEIDLACETIQPLIDKVEKETKL